MCQKSCGSFLAGLIFGAAAGAALALLYAPTTGKEARKILKKKAGLAKKKALEARDELLKGIGELKEKAETEAKGLERKAKRAVSGAVRGFKKSE